jgi:hypothetical protein
MVKQQNRQMVLKPELFPFSHFLFLLLAPYRSSYH